MPYLEPSARNLRRYNSRLQRAFPDVRVRWSQQLQAFQLEEQVTRQREVDPAKYPVHALDTFIRARDGFDLIREIDQPFLPTPDRMIEALQRNDSRRIGRSPQERADHLDTLDQLAAEHKRRARRDKAQAIGSELYDLKYTSHRPSATYHG